MNQKSENPFALYLSLAAIETLRALFVNGPLYDGDIPSKTGRDELVKFGLVSRHNGYQQLTHSGLVMALEAKMDIQKQRDYHEARMGLRLLAATRPILFVNESGRNAAPVSNASGYPTVDPKWIPTAEYDLSKKEVDQKIEEMQNHKNNSK